MFGFTCKKRMNWHPISLESHIFWLRISFRKQKWIEKEKEMFLEIKLYDLSEIYWGSFCVWVFKSAGKFYDHH